MSWSSAPHLPACWSSGRAEMSSIFLSSAGSISSPMELPSLTDWVLNSTGNQEEPLGQSEHQPRGENSMFTGLSWLPVYLRIWAFGTPIAGTLKPAASRNLVRAWVSCEEVWLSLE